MALTSATTAAFAPAALHMAAAAALG